eukprot:GHVQ01001401.1.p1 GENE.GHVQ01001401.1~~GHVQ01001401.1.p1  ORF type:complete len:228 (+),score=52.92 GHVQ01001401.1:324-1007(+)
MHHQSQLFMCLIWAAAFFSCVHRGDVIRFYMAEEYAEGCTSPYCDGSSCNTEASVVIPIPHNHTDSTTTQLAENNIYFNVYVTAADESTESGLDGGSRGSWSSSEEEEEEAGVTMGGRFKSELENVLYAGIGANRSNEAVWEDHEEMMCGRTMVEEEDECSRRDGQVNEEHNEEGEEVECGDGSEDLLEMMGQDFMNELSFDQDEGNVGDGYIGDGYYMGDMFQQLF